MTEYHRGHGYLSPQVQFVKDLESLKSQRQIRLNTLPGQDVDFEMYRAKTYAILTNKNVTFTYKRISKEKTMIYTPKLVTNDPEFTHEKIEEKIRNSIAELYRYQHYKNIDPIEKKLGLSHIKQLIYEQKLLMKILYK